MTAQTSTSPERAKYRKLLKYDHDRGIKRLSDVAPARDHCLRLIEAGMTVSTIAYESGMSEGTIRPILGQRRDGRNNTKIRSVTAQKLLAVKFVDKRGTLVPAIGSTRRLRDLALRGFANTEIEALTGISDSFISRLRRGTVRHMKPETEKAVSDVFKALDGQSPTLTSPSGQGRLKRAAQKARWQPIAVFDDPDNPLDRPKLRRRRVG